MSPYATCFLCFRQYEVNESEASKKHLCSAECMEQWDKEKELMDRAAKEGR